MGSACNCADSSSRFEEGRPKKSWLDSTRDSDAMLDLNKESILNCCNRNKKRDYSSPTIQAPLHDLDPKSSEFRQFKKHLRQKYPGQEYDQHMKLLKMRPELLPYYLMQYNKWKDETINQNTQYWLSTESSRFSSNSSIDSVNFSF